MKLPIHQVDAFADSLFQGNPAAVCLLTEWLPDGVLQAIAAENHVSETAFLLPDRDPIPLRWFTPVEEVPLCGHATLAAAFIVLDALHARRDAVTFDSRSGQLVVTRDGAEFSLDFPSLASEIVSAPADLIEGLGRTPVETRRVASDPNYLAILGREEDVRALRPDLHALERLHPYGVAVSAPGTNSDFVSRYFAPGYGIPEDPVTGSVHCALGPYWAERLGTDSLRAVQLSTRGGRIGIRVAGERVHLTGGAVLYMSGEIDLP